MTASKLKRLITKESLFDAWQQLHRKAKKQKSSGVDNITVASFEANKDQYIATIYRQIHSKDGYRFSPLYGNPIEKRNSTKKRIICIPTVADRLVQRCIGSHLTAFANERGIINDASFGFVSSKPDDPRGVAAARNKAIALRNQSPWAYKSDISAFFDRIPRDEVVKQTISILRARSFKKIIDGVVRCEIDNRDAAVARVARENGIIRGQGVRQGMPLSPLFSNIILRDFDSGLLKQGRKLVRYADDFIILANSNDECVEIDKVVRELLRPLDLNLPALSEKDSKTQIKNPHEEIEFLGLSLTPVGNNKYQLLLPKDHLDEISRSINRLKDVRELVRNKIDITKFLQKLERQISGYRAAYGDAQNRFELDAILEKARSQMLRQIFANAFSEQRVIQLSEDYKRFFGLTS